MDRAKRLEDFDVQCTFERLAAEGALQRANHIDRQRRWRRFNIRWFVLLALPLLALLVLAQVSVVHTPYSFIACDRGETVGEVYSVANKIFE